MVGNGEYGSTSQYGVLGGNPQWGPDRGSWSGTVCRITDNFMNTAESTISRSSDGREFQATGPAWEKDRSPNFDLSPGVTYDVESADRSPDRVALPTTERTQSAMYAGHVPTGMECMIEHNLNCIRYRIGN